MQPAYLPLPELQRLSQHLGVQEEYELVIPRGGPLSSQAGTIGKAGLAPSVLLYYRRSTSRNVPALSRALLALAQPAGS